MSTIRKQVSDIAKKSVTPSLKKGYLAEEFDGVGNTIQVTLSKGSSSAVQASIAAGAFGTEQTFPEGTPVFVLEYRGRFEVVSLGSKMGAETITVEMFPSGGVDASTDSGPVIAPGTLPGTVVVDGGITTTQIGEGSITTPLLGTNAIKTIHIDSGQITGDLIDATTITADKFAAELLLVDTKIMTGESGARLELDDTGLYGFDTYGEKTVAIPTNGDSVYFKGEVHAASFVALNGAEIRTTSLFAAGSITTLGNGVSNPGAIPSISSALEYLQIGTPANVGHGVCYDSTGGPLSDTATYWVGANSTVGNLLDMAYEYNASTGTLLRTLQKTGTEQTLTDYLGEQTHISDQAVLRQGATYSQIATPLTFPSNRGTCTITAVSVYVAGYSGTCSVRNAVWATDGNLLTQSSAYAAANKAWSNGNSVKYNKAVTAYAVAAGTTVRAGFLRTNTSDYSQWDQDAGSGKTEYRGDGNNGDMTSVETFSSQKPNVYITYNYQASSSEEGTTGQTIGVARASTSVFCLDANGYLFKYNQSDLDYLSKADLSSYITGTKANAGLFYDATAAKLMIVTFDGTGATAKVKWIVVNPTTMAVESTSTDDSGQTHNGSTSTIRGGVRYNDPLNSNTAEYWISLNGVVRAYLQSNGDYVSDRDFGQSTEASSGVTYDGTYFRTWSSASNSTKIWKYSTWDWTTQSAVYWCCYSWYDGGTEKSGTATASSDLVNVTSHGWTTGDRVRFGTLTGGTGLNNTTDYWIISSGLTADAFKVSLTSGGSAVDITVDYSALTVGRSHETGISSRASITMGRRRQLSVVTPAIPSGGVDDPNRVRIYLNRGSSDPGGTSYYLNKEDALTSRLIDSFSDTGSAPLAANNFPAGTPAELKSAATGWTLKGSGLINRTGTAFPPSPATNDHFWRSDLGMEFFYNGTRWLSTTLFTVVVPIWNTAAQPASASVADAFRVSQPPLAGGSDLWVESLKAGYLLAAGTGPDASNNWAYRLIRYDGTVGIGSDNKIDSGAETTWATREWTIDALAGDYAMWEIDLIKTGTPGTLSYQAPIITYRIVAT